MQVAECCTEEEPFCLCSGGPTEPGFCATAEVAAATTCLAVEDGTCCDADGNPRPPPPGPLPGPVGPGEDCCPEGQSCCGDGCIPTEQLPLALCPVAGLCGCCLLYTSDAADE